jgi:hypothetical protein
MGRLHALHCNHNLKKTFSQTRFDFFAEKPIKAARDHKDICPYLHYTCCSVEELAFFVADLAPRINAVVTYHNDLKDYFKRIQAFDVPRFLDNFERLTSGNFPKCKLIERPEEMEHTIAQMVNKVPSMLIDIDRMNKLIVKYFSGFLCTMCDPEDHAHISINEAGKMQMVFNVAMCDPLLNMKKLHHKVVLEMINHFFVADAIACLFVTDKINVTMVANIKTSLEKRVSEIDGCINLDDTRTEVYHDPACLKICSERIFFQQYINSYEFSAIAEIGYKMLAAFNAGTFEMDETSIANIASQILDSNSPNFFRRYFGIWHSHSQNAYDDINFSKILAFRGINFFDNKVILPEVRVLRGLAG